MKVAVIGGKLQGVEATYLAHQAGWEVVLIDKNAYAPATGMCDEFYQVEISADPERVAEIVSKTDLIIPAIEDQAVLEMLAQIARSGQVPLAFDHSAYTFSSSKQRSDELLHGHGIPAPAYWPDCTLPVIAKPSFASGSHGVRKFYNARDLTEFLGKLNGDRGNWVIQEYLEGLSYSIEVIGANGQVVALQTTDLGMDRSYDCKRVSAPTELSDSIESEFREIAVEIARLINLNGIMDVEVINHHGTLKVLEIDARLPSQTPTAVYKSSGVNMIENLFQVFAQGTAPQISEIVPSQAVVYEHLRVGDESIETLGEHIMANAGPLTYFRDFFGADEAISNFRTDHTAFVATLIITAPTNGEAWAKRCDVIENIRSHYNLSFYLDSSPDN
ncbi:3-methylornithine--L-lysine ligase PylC [Paradesulfitobacterium aromaticivorans]